MLAYKRGIKEEKGRSECTSPPHRGEERKINKSDYGEVVSCPDPIQLMLREGSVVTNPNPWASSRSMEQSMKSQSYV